MKRLALFLALVILGAVAFTVFVSDRAENPAITIGREAGAASYFETKSEPSPLNVLIIGSDVREGDPRAGRADSLHVLALNPSTKEGTLVGIPRDSYVAIPGQGTSKINASLLGGPERVVQTVQNFTGLPIHYWALIDFSRFRSVVDQLGGVEIDVPYEVRDRAYSGSDFPAGRRLMNGADALAYARARHGVPGGDFGRSENQGRLLLASLAKFKHEIPNPLRLALYFRTFQTFVQSNVPARELITLARFAAGFDPSKIANVVVPGGTGNAGGASVVFPNPGDMFARINFDATL